MILISFHNASDGNAVTSAAEMVLRFLAVCFMVRKQFPSYFAQQSLICKGHEIMACTSFEKGDTVAKILGLARGDDRLVAIVFAVAEQNKTRSELRLFGQCNKAQDSDELDSDVQRKWVEAKQCLCSWPTWTNRDIDAPRATGAGWGWTVTCSSPCAWVCDISVGLHYFHDVVTKYRCALVG